MWRHNQPALIHSSHHKPRIRLITRNFYVLATMWLQPYEWPIPKKNWPNDLSQHISCFKILCFGVDYKAIEQLPKPSPHLISQLFLYRNLLIFTIPNTTWCCCSSLSNRNATNREFPIHIQRGRVGEMGRRPGAGGGGGGWRTLLFMLIQILPIFARPSSSVTSIITGICG